MKTLPEILAPLDRLDGLGQYGKHRKEAQDAIAKELMGCLPEKRLYTSSNPEPQGEVFASDLHENTGRNEALDEVRARLTAFIG